MLAFKKKKKKNKTIKIEVFYLNSTIKGKKHTFPRETQRDFLLFYKFHFTSKERNYFFSQISSPLLHTLSKHMAKFSCYQPLSSSAELFPPQLFRFSTESRHSPKPIRSVQQPNPATLLLRQHLLPLCFHQTKAGEHCPR